MIKQILFLFFLFGSNFNLNGQSNYKLIYQSGLSTIMGVEIIASTNFIFIDFESKYLKPTLFNTPNKKIRNGVLNGLYRFSKTYTVDRTKDNFLKIFQHEVFGHGSRLREYGYTKNRYHIGFPNSGGTAWFGVSPKNRTISLEEDIMIRIGGVESTMLLSNKIRNNWIENGKIDVREAYFYFRSFTNLDRYIKNTNEVNFTSSNDIYNYFGKINRLNNIDLEETSFTIDYLKKRAIINYLNPLQYYGLYTLIKDYIILGREEVELPMIPIGRYKYLPLIRMGLTPFGTEMYFENFVKSEHSLNTFYIRKGDGVFHDFYGLGIKKTNIIESDFLIIDAEIDIWKQPEMQLGGEVLKIYDAGIGAAIKLGIGLKLFEEPNASYIHGTFGYKNVGYLEGEYLEAGFFTRIGLMILN